MEDVELEHRLTMLEAAIENGFRVQIAATTALAFEVGGLKEQIRIQNGRLRTIEQWKERIIGETDGKREISRGQLAFVAVIGPALFATVDIVVRITTGG